MGRLSTFGRIAAAAALASAGLLATARPVAAECTFIPPLPKVSMAIATAKELFVGEVVANGSNRAEFTVRVDEVLRGPARVGGLRTFSYLRPNWPWANYPGGQPYASCSTIYAETGEHIIVALGARTSGGIIEEGDMRWYQPPTTFNTIGITEGSSREQYGSGGRQLFSLERLRELARLAPPPTDTLGAPFASRPPVPWLGTPVVLLIAAGIMGGLAAWRRTRTLRRPHR
jgi:hypothetical protein